MSYIFSLPYFRSVVLCISNFHARRTCKGLLKQNMVLFIYTIYILLWEQAIILFFIIYNIYIVVILSLPYFRSVVLCIPNVQAGRTYKGLLKQKKVLFRYSIYILLWESAIILFCIIYNVYIVVIYLEFAPF